MKKSFYSALLSAAFLASFTATPAKAVMVDYSTSGTAITSPAPISITYTPVSATVDADPATFASLGSFTVAGITNTNQSINSSFVLSITQTSPTGGMQSLSSDIVGSIKSNSSTTSVTFASDTVTIGSVTYKLRSKVWDLVPPSTNGGVTTIQGLITAVPEPSFVLLSSVGMMGLLAIAYRRTRRSES